MIHKETKSKNILKIVAISSVGGGLEMYDFVIYAFFAPILGKLFFPKTDSITALLSAFAVFAIGYFIRPLGAIFFGHFGDTLGRKKILMVTITMMAASTVLMGCLPTYQHLGLTSTLLLALLRLLQGFAMGGDLPGAITFVAEHVPKSRRGMHCSWIYTGINLGFTLAAVVSTVIASQMKTSQLEQWGWRIAFWFGLIVAVAGYYLRTLLEETPNFKKVIVSEFVRRFPIQALLKNEFSAFLKAIGLVCLVALIIGQMLFMPSYLHIVNHYSMNKALFLNTCGMLVWTLLIVVAGFCSDIFGRKPVMAFSVITLILFSHFLFSLLASTQIYSIVLALLGFAVFMSGIMGGFSSTISELFTTPVRNSGVGTAYNLSFALFCSVTPVIMTFLMKKFGVTGPSYWVIVCAVITGITLFTIPETAQQELRDQ